MLEVEWNFAWFLLFGWAFILHTFLLLFVVVQQTNQNMWQSKPIFNINNNTFKCEEWTRIKMKKDWFFCWLQTNLCNYSSKNMESDKLIIIFLDLLTKHTYTQHMVGLICWPINFCMIINFFSFFSFSSLNL